MITSYKYVSCEDGASQYDDYDLTSQTIVPALYIKAKQAEDRGNPYIEALPYPKKDEGVLIAYNTDLPSYKYDRVKKMSKYDKMLQIGSLRNLRFPLPFHSQLEFAFYGALLTSYRARKQLHSTDMSVSFISEGKERDTGSILVGKSSDATNAGFSLIGYSGCGKSSAVGVLVSHYPQVIMHSDGKGGYFPQITYLVVNCTANSNFAALYQGIGEAIDKAFGNITPVYERAISKTSGLGRKADKIREYIEKFAIGIIIFDEIQLLDFSHTRENTFDSLLTLANRTKVAIAVVGTEDARNKMFRELRTARRVGTMINGNDYCKRREFFNVLVSHLFQYQWFDELVQPNKDIADALYDVTKGIIDQLIGVYSCMNLEYLQRNKKPDINGEYVREIARKYYPGIQNVLARMETEETEQKLSEIVENAEFRIDQMIEEAKQEEEAKKIVESQSVMANQTILLKNVVANIRNIFDEYTEQQIEDVFKKVIARKSAAGKTEREITKLVLEQLQKTPKRREKKSKIAAPDIDHMRDFLELED